VIFKFEIGTISDITYDYQVMTSACVSVSMIPTDLDFCMFVMFFYINVSTQLFQDDITINLSALLQLRNEEVEIRKQSLY